MAGTPVSLRLRHDALPAEALEEIIGESAKVKWSAGQLHRNLRAADEGVVYKDTFCAFGVPEAGTLSLDDAIVALNKRLQRQAPALSTLPERNIEIEVYATLDQTRRGQTFGVKAISALSEMNASLAIDWVKTDKSSNAQDQ